MIESKKLQLCTCERCGYIWIPQVRKDKNGKIKQKLPTGCAKCKNHLWNVPVSEIPRRGKRHG